MSASRPSGATFVTLTDERYFLGTVALVNSLSLTGNAGRVIVIDAGLTPHQVRRLSAVCEIRALAPSRTGVPPPFLKPVAVTLALELGLEGAIVFIDSDMIATDSLRPILEQVREGRICLLPDGPPRLEDRQFDEWVSVLGLEGHLRRQPYINSGLIAFRADLWDLTLHRWRELCERAAEHALHWPQSVPHEVNRAHPFAYFDQDVLNAILMSEVAADRIRILDWQMVGVPEPDDTTRLVDRTSLGCRKDGGPTLLLHYLAHPKPWRPGAQTCLRYEPYDELLARLLSSRDVPIRLGPEEVPRWMRDGRAHRLLRRAVRSNAKPVRLLHSVQRHWAMGPTRRGSPAHDG